VKPSTSPSLENGGPHHASSLQERHQTEHSLVDIRGTIKGSALHPKEMKVLGNYITVDGDAPPIFSSENLSHICVAQILHGFIRSIAELYRDKHCNERSVNDDPIL